MKKLLVVVDYQNDFVDGSLGFEDAKCIENNLVNLIKEYKNNNDEVVFTYDTHYENYMATIEGNNLPIPHCIKGTDGHELFGKVKELADNCLKFEKETFGSKELAKFLENKNYQSITLVGVVTNICVLSNAIVAKTITPNTPIFVDASCSASNDKVMEQKAYDVLENLHIKVINR